MVVIYNTLLVIHISFGFASLVLFWIPIFSRKGGNLHVQIGNWYVNAMYIVGFTAIAAASIVMSDPIAIKHVGNTFSAEEMQRVLNHERNISQFLLSISLLVISNVQHGVLSLKAKQNHSLMRASSHLFINVLLVAAGVGLLLSANGSTKILFYVFAGISITAGLRQLHYCLKSEVSKMEWMIAHMGAMIGAGIGSYTAFAVFGGGRYLAEYLHGNWILLPWIAPGVIGGMFTAYLTKKYRKKYNIATKPSPLTK